MYRDGFSWRVFHFNIFEWIVEPTVSQINWRRNLCGVRALVRSMQNQYPASRLANTQIEDVLKIFDEVQAGRHAHEQGQSEANVQKILNRWIGNFFRLIVVRYEN
jgi:hypothetical protein